MIHSYTEIVAYGGHDFEPFFDRLGIGSVFRPILEKYVKDPPLISKLIKYVMWVYSIDSPRTAVGVDWGKVKAQIFNDLDFNKELYTDVVLLQCPELQKTVEKWLDYQDNRLFSQLCNLQDLYVEMQSASLSRLMKADGMTVDYDQKFKCVGYAEELRKMIANVEAELQQTNGKLKTAFMEARKANKEHHTYSIESAVKKTL